MALFNLATGTGGAQNSTGAMQVPETDKPFLLTYANLDSPDGEVLLESDRVILQRLVVGPWQSSFKPTVHQPLYRDSVTVRMKKTPAHPV